MGRILAIDYGRKRVGIATTDTMAIIANGLATVAVHEIWNWLDDYLTKEDVSTIVIGNPKKLNNEPSESISFIEPFIKHLKKRYPDKAIELIDERFTSKMASQAILDAGAKKKKRQDKALVDKVSATIILQSYLEQNI